MTNLPWILLAVGTLVMLAGWSVGWRAGGKTIVTLGLVNAALGAVLLIGNNAPHLRLPALAGFAVVLLIVVARVPRDAWWEARWETVLGIATMAGLVLLAALPRDVSAPIQNGLLVGLVTIATAFIVVTLVRSVKLVAHRRQ